MIRVGLVGAGPWAELFTAPLLSAAPELSFAAVWARRPEAAQALADQHGTTAVDSFEALLDSCDAVAFNVPADIQAPLAVKAARAGKHLLLEKPVAFTVAEAEAVASAADEAGVTTQLMLTYRFTDPVKAFLAEATQGKVEYVRTTFIGGGALGGPFATPWRQTPGAVLLDLGPHTLDLAEATAGAILELHATEAGSVIAVTTQHEDGATGHLAISGTTPGAHGRLEAEAVTAAGSVVLPDPTPYEPGPLLHTIAAEFACTVRGERPQPLDVHRGVHLQRLIAAVAESIDSKTVVTL